MVGGTLEAGGTLGGTVGGTVAGAGNTIAYSGWDGLRNNGAGTDNSFLGNQIHGNVEQGIEIGEQRGLKKVSARPPLKSPEPCWKMV